MTVEALPPRGWYEDPADEARERYWDGRQWTQRVRRKAAPRRRADLVGAPGDVTGAESRVTANVTLPGYSPAPPVAETADRVAGFPLATWGRRVAGSLVDGLIITLLLALVLLVARDFTSRLVTEWDAWLHTVLDQTQPVTWPMFTPPPALVGLVNQMVWIRGGLVAIYSLAFLATWSATPGMRLLGLKVVPAPLLDRVAALPPKWISAQDAAQRLGWARAAWRSLAWAVLDAGLSFLTFVQIFSLLMPLWHPRRQAVHDLVARTVVIRQRL